MGKIILGDNYIKSLPITTDRVKVSWDKDKLFAKYSIVSYHSMDPERKSSAYEQLGNVPFISVTGIKNRWGAQCFPSVQFLILTTKGKEQEVLNSLRAYDDVKAESSTLEKYKDKLQQRIIASLAINSLGKKKNSDMVYNNGPLPVCDDKNFGAHKSHKELVCLEIEVSEYMDLTVQTTSFSNSFSKEDLLKHRTYVFQISKGLDGEFWSGQSVKPIIIKSVKGSGYDLEKLFIQKKNFKDSKNLVPYRPYNVEDYAHGKLYVIWQVAESVDDAFKGILSIKSTGSQIIHYDECKTKDEILTLAQEYLAGRGISFGDPFRANGSKSVISNFKNEAQEIMSGFPIFPKKPAPDDIIVKLCEPEGEGCEVT